MTHSSQTTNQQQTALQSMMYEVFHEIDAMRAHGELQFIDNQDDPLAFFNELSRTTGVAPGILLSSTIHVNLHRLGRAVHGGRGTSEDHRRQINELISQLVLARYMIEASHAQEVRRPSVAMSGETPSGRVPLAALE